MCFPPFFVYSITYFGGVVYQLEIAFEKNRAQLEVYMEKYTIKL